MENRHTASSAAALAIFIVFSTMAPDRVFAEKSKDPAQPAVVSGSLLRFSSESLQGAILSNLIGGMGVFRIQLGSEPLNGIAAAGEPDTWTLWASPAYSRFENSIKPYTSKGKVMVGLAGLEYNHEDETFAGISLALDRLAATTTYNSGTIDGSGYTLSPYLMHYLSQTWILNSSLGVGQTKFESTATDVTSRPTTKKGLFSLGLTNINTHGKFYSMLKLNYNRFVDDTASHANSAGNVNSRLKNTLSQLVMGAQVNYSSGIVKPFLGVNRFINQSDSSSSDKVPQEYAATNQYVIGLNFSKDLLYGSLGYYIERDKSQLRVYAGIRY